ncbi:MAG: UDP-3-O-(3-hydroxymyristoyl)glucosamine N-acyltransferase, partial [Fluviibacter sp.]
VIGDDVEVGANTCIDRGALDDTVIGDGVKIDDQIMIGHNCRIGDHTAIAACAGIAGSTTIGKRCIIGGAAMFSGHNELTDDVIISGGTAVIKDIRKPGQYTGVFPSLQHADWLHIAANLRHLDTLAKKVQQLEAQIKTLTEQHHGD